MFVLTPLHDASNQLLVITQAVGRVLSCVLSCPLLILNGKWCLSCTHEAGLVFYLVVCVLCGDPAFSHVIEGFSIDPSFIIVKMLSRLPLIIKGVDVVYNFVLGLPLVFETRASSSFEVEGSELFISLRDVQGTLNFLEL
jgi:hypothetical protein